MFKQKKMLYLTVETPLHAGTGRGLGSVDLPIQRERTTGYPMAQSSGVKGCLRAEADPKTNQSAKKLSQQEFETIFGPDTNNAADFAGALSVGDARLLFFPVRSLAGVFAWVTCRDVLSRFQREAALVGVSLPWGKMPASDPQPEQAWVNGNTLLAGGSVVLEEFSFTTDPSQATFVKSVADWAAANVLPAGAEYDYWRKAFPEKLCILPENAFRDFVLYGLEVQTHIALNPETKTVDSKKGALWTSESLPVDSILYTPLLATDSRNQSFKTMDAAKVLARLQEQDLPRIQMGGDETTGQGMVALRFS